jgi:hypothetical protein
MYMCALILYVSFASPYPLFPKVLDVAQALSNLIGMPAIDRTLALPGPSTLTYEYLLELVSTLTCNPPSRTPVVPKPVVLALAHVAQCIWWPALSPDEVERCYIDDADAPGDWALVDVEPDEIENHAITYVRRYRSAYVSTLSDSMSSESLGSSGQPRKPCTAHIGPPCDPLSLDIYTSFI